MYSEQLCVNNDTLAVTVNLYNVHARASCCFYAYYLKV